MPQFLAWVSLVLIGILTVSYSYSTLTGKIKPVLTTWFLFAVVTWLSLLSYFFSGAHSLTGNILNVTDVLMCTLFFILIIVKNKAASFRFTNFEIFCLVLSGLILIFWGVSKEHTTANLLLQVVLVIAYFPMIIKLWRATTSTENLWMWIINWTATLSGLIAAILKHDFLGSIYALRGLILIGVLLFLILRVSRKSNLQSIENKTA